MSEQGLRLTAPRPALQIGREKLPLGRCLLDAGVITDDQLLQALQMQLRLAAPLGEILVAEGWVTADDVLAALARQNGLAVADLVDQPPDPELVDMMPYQFWLRHRVIPWMRLGNAMLIATPRPDLFKAVQDGLGPDCPDIVPVLADEVQITRAIALHFAKPMAQAAECRVPAQFSCRGWRGLQRLPLLAVLLALFGLIAAAPLAGLAALSLLALTTLILFIALKLSGFLAHMLSHPHLMATGAPPEPCTGVAHFGATLSRGRLPKVSVLVPLFRETEIAGALVRRLNRLTYPKALLDVVFVLEEHDALTRQTLADCQLPSWIRVIEVPAHNGLTTKPRAMNYALDFCQGEIIGVWDAEDAPVPDQIERVVARFASVPEEVVCLQGILDYYNPRTNWLARCFTIEYSSWFRVVLPGIARLGLVVPLGGTTLFFRRAQLEQLGGWDAHNVTEDADLGVRLCRAGWRTELIDTVTFEEANCRAWPWIRQRSRWLKGFMLTYLVHMRAPKKLWADLGAWRFFGFQAFFLGTLGQFLLAPVLWSFWLLAFGVGQAVIGQVPSGVVYGAGGILLFSEILSLCISLAAVSQSPRRHLLMWAPTMMFYFPLGAVAAYKALAELLVRPYYWDKTEHGHAPADEALAQGALAQGALAQGGVHSGPVG